MLERLASESSMNVYEFLMTMRQQRVHLVQTLVRGGGGGSVSWESGWSALSVYQFLLSLDQ